ncbi:MAG TPA: hypothetical protein VJB41_03050 [Patescibacteria group bacterium]|nr:hypothetical protein [Patescibacteria group bacterium]
MHMPKGGTINPDLIREDKGGFAKESVLEELGRKIEKFNKEGIDDLSQTVDNLDQDFAEVLAKYAKEAESWGLLQLRVERKIETEGLKILARKFNGDGLDICGERDFSMEEVQELVEYVRRTGGNLFLRFDHAISPEMLEMLLSLPTEIEKCLFIDLPKGMERAGKLMREHDFARAYVDGEDVDDLVFDERKSIKKTIDALPEEARAQIEDWLTFFDSNPNFKHLVAESGVELMDFMKKNKIANPEAFHNLNAGKDVKVLLKDFKALLVLLPKNFSQETFEEIFERKNDIGYQDNDVFLTVYADELVQTIADYLSSIKNSLDEKARKRGALSKRIIFLREKIAEIDNLKAKKKMQKQLLAAEESEQRDFSKIDKQQQGCSELLDRLANFNYLALGKSGFRLAGRTREELTLGDKCSDCTSANISGMNFWTVPVWLADPGFNFLLQYDENGRLAHKFGVVLDINRKGEIVLIVDSLELADAQKEQAGMYGGLADERKEQDMMDEAIDFIKQWAKRMGLDSQNIYSTSFSNTGVKELEWYPLKQISVAKLGGLESLVLR